MNHLINPQASMIARSAAMSRLDVERTKIGPTSHAHSISPRARFFCRQHSWSRVGLVVEPTGPAVIGVPSSKIPLGRR